MKSIILLCLVSVFYNTALGQTLTENNLIGVWQVEDIAVNLEFENERQEERVNSIKDGFNSAQFFFSADQKFTIELHPDAPATFDDEMFIDIYTWELTHENKRVRIGNNVMEIIVTEREGIYFFDFQVGLVLQMKKINDEAIISIEDKIKSATKKDDN